MKKISQQSKGIILNSTLKKPVTRTFGLALVIGTLAAIAGQAAHAGTTGDKGSYNCAVDVLKSGDADANVNSLAASCIGNSHDPDRSEIQAFKDAIRDVTGSRKQQPTQPHDINTLKPITTNTEANPCPFAYGVYMANGSHADNFEEGPQRVSTMKMTARMLPGREFTIYGVDGKPLPNQVVNQLFYVAKKDQYGATTIGITDYAKKYCTKKQLG